MEPTSTCSAPDCNAAIWYGLTDAGRRMPCDPTPSPDGRVVRVTGTDGRVRLHVLTGDELPWLDPVTVDVGPYVAHHQTCRAGAAFRSAAARGMARCRACGLPMGRPGNAGDRELIRAEGWVEHPSCDTAAAAARARHAARRRDAAPVQDPLPEAS